VFVADEDPSTHTDPLDSDSDDDDLTDGQEDADHDGKRDETETDPNDEDTDDGGVPDGVEVNSGMDPLDPADDAPTTVWVQGGCMGCASTRSPGLGWAVALLPLLALRRRRAA